MVVSELNRRLAWLKVTVCLGLPWLRPNHNVAPGNRMSPWLCAKLTICASPTSNQELKNWCAGSLSPLLVQSHFLAFPAASLIPVSSIQYSQCGAHVFQMGRPLLPLPFTLFFTFLPAQRPP